MEEETETKLCGPRPGSLSLHETNDELIYSCKLSYLQLRTYNECMATWSRRYGTIASGKSLLLTSVETVERLSVSDQYKRYAQVLIRGLEIPQAEAVISVSFPTRLVERATRIFYANDYSITHGNATVYTHIITAISVACALWEEERKTEAEIEVAGTLLSLQKADSGDSVCEPRRAEEPVPWNYKVLHPTRGQCLSPVGWQLRSGEMEATV
jgi:hypothetical protein